MRLLVRNFQSRKRVSREWMGEIASLTVKTVKGGAFEGKSELSVVLAGDAQTRRLNRVYRKMDKPTDVLSFPLLEGKKLKTGRGNAIPLGDVVLCVPQILRQARGNAGGFRGEMELMLVHGILHLLGYDHATQTEEKRMFGLQGRILSRIRK